MERTVRGARAACCRRFSRGAAGAGRDAIARWCPEGRVAVAAQHRTGERGQERGEDDPVYGAELYFLRLELALEKRELVA